MPAPWRPPPPNRATRPSACTNRAAHKSAGANTGRGWSECCERWEVGSQQNEGGEPEEDEESHAISDEGEEHGAAVGGIAPQLMNDRGGKIPRQCGHHLVEQHGRSHNHAQGRI